MSAWFHGCVHSVKIYWTVHFWCVYSSAFWLYFNKFFRRCCPWPTNWFPNSEIDCDFRFHVNGDLWSCAGRWPAVILPQAARWVFQVNCSWASTEHTASQRQLLCMGRLFFPFRSGLNWSVPLKKAPEQKCFFSTYPVLALYVYNLLYLQDKPMK